MGLLSGYEKYGVHAVTGSSLYDSSSPVKEPEPEKKQKPEGPVTPVKEPDETDFLFDKTIRCPVCDKVFKTKIIKSNRLRRLEPDADLRPNHVGIDSIKYDVASCPYCGYTAMNRYFEHLSSLQIKLIKENVCIHFQKGKIDPPPVYTYPEAIERYKASLANALIKHGKASEIAYNCLKISWLMRSYIPMMPENTEVDVLRKNEMIADQKEAYEQAYDGFIKAIADENYPIAGMDQTTLDYLIANMAFTLGKTETAARLISGILVSTTAPAKIKDKAREMKQQILEQLKKR